MSHRDDVPPESMARWREQCADGARARSPTPVEQIERALAPRNTKECDNCPECACCDPRYIDCVAALRKAVAALDVIESMATIETADEVGVARRALAEIARILNPTTTKGE